MTLPAWTGRGDGWWAQVALAVGAAIVVLGVAAAPSAEGRVEVAGLGLVTLAGFAAKGRWPGLPAAVLAVWTFAPPIVANLRRLGEVTVFLLIVAVSFFVLVEPDRHRRVAAGTAAALSVPVIQVVSPQDWGWPLWMLGIAFGWLSSEQMRRFRGLVSELQATRQRLADQAVHLERRRIAAELHDLVGHSLTVVLLHVTGARRRVQDDPAAAVDALEQAEAIGRASLAEIRRSVAALRHDDPMDAATAPTPAAGDVPALVHGLAATGAAVALDVTGDLAEIEAVTGLAVYRVVQESLSNAARHAGGAPVRVAVTVAAGGVAIEVVDCGTSATTPDGAGTGLVGMRERVDALGGTFAAGPVRGGWRVHAWVPRAPLPVGERRRA